MELESTDSAENPTDQTDVQNDHPPVEGTVSSKELSTQDSTEEPQEHSEDLGKPKRRGSGRRRERVNSKKAAAAQSTPSATSADANDDVDSSEETARPVAKEAESPESSSSETATDTETVTQSIDQQPADEAKVSQRQPSQLKSSVRSLANKDEAATGGLSLASRKVPDVIPDKVVSTSASVGTAAVEQASTQTPAVDKTSQAADEISAAETVSGSASEIKIAAEKVNE